MEEMHGIESEKCVNFVTTDLGGFLYSVNLKFKK